jgi:hypothetical protein
MNHYLKTLALAAVVGFGSMGFAMADEINKMTVVTIDQPVQLPTMVLQPGTYVIKLLDTVNRHVVQVYDKGEQHLVTTVLAIPNLRIQPTGKSVFAFWETPAGQPAALRAWFYPGDSAGQEFAYPKGEAARISARNNGAKVPVNEDTSRDIAADATTTAAESAPPAPAAAVVPAPSAQPAPAPAPAPIQVAAAQAPPAPAVTPDPPASSATATTSASQTTTTPDALPQTASHIPLLALLGILSMIGALALKVAYNRS